MIAQTQPSVLVTETHMNNFEVNVTNVTLKKSLFYVLIRSHKNTDMHGHHVRYYILYCVRNV